MSATARTWCTTVWGACRRHPRASRGPTLALAPLFRCSSTATPSRAARSCRASCRSAAHQRHPVGACRRCRRPLLRRSRGGLRARLGGRRMVPALALVLPVLLPLASAPTVARRPVGVSGRRPGPVPKLRVPLLTLTRRSRRDLCGRCPRRCQLNPRARSVVTARKAVQLAPVARQQQRAARVAVTAAVPTARRRLLRRQG
mmetsp:Transcript_28400/g.98075  ORF Transcript_28400/g.98075 Transcript_28400/m.98075 type:complete len:201 (-) Transcript_28400:438-1040(-)